MVLQAELVEEILGLEDKVASLRAGKQSMRVRIDLVMHRIILHTQPSEMAAQQCA